MQRKGIKNSSTIMNQLTNLPHCKKVKREWSKMAGKKEGAGNERFKRG
jgi:hypothetical protein